MEAVGLHFVLGKPLAKGLPKYPTLSQGKSLRRLNMRLKIRLGMSVSDLTPSQGKNWKDLFGKWGTPQGPATQTHQVRPKDWFEIEIS